MYKLIIAEKPAAARKIASALGHAKFVKSGYVGYYEIPRQNVRIAAAVGHLFGLRAKKSGYPVFDIEWVPIYEISKTSKFAKPYIALLHKLASSTGELIIATDYDIEGELIGLNIMRFIYNKKDASRMKFSTLTKSELQQAFERRSRHIDWGQANAGETRHILDWYYGINLSKAAMAALKSAINGFKTLSIGRVQGPALAILAEREKEIAAFIPKPYWQIFANFKFGRAIHIKERFDSKELAQKIFEKVKDKPAKLIKLNKKAFQIYPPTPFDLTTLQIEAWRAFKIPPARTLEIAQQLYLAALISYPRTSSQKLPPQIGYARILTALGKNEKYTKAAKELLKGKLRPRQGKKTDPAHPAVHPTGELPKNLTKEQAAIYDLIVRRFLAVFGQPAEREQVNLRFDIEGEEFKLALEQTTTLGWLKYYKPYSNLREDTIPKLVRGNIYQQKTELESKKTSPPPRYTPASIVAELEKRNLGTKGTRAQIIDILYQRGYIYGSPIHVSPLGMKVVDVFANYAPEILSEELTREFERALEAIYEGKAKKEKILSRAREIITKLCKEIDQHQREIGLALAEALAQTQKEELARRTLMACPRCHKGDLIVIRSKKSGKRFLACSNYPACKTAYPLPQKGSLRMLKTKCPKCGANLISVKVAGKRAWKLCINCGVQLTKKQSKQKQS